MTRRSLSAPYHQFLPESPEDDPPIVSCHECSDDLDFDNAKWFHKNHAERFNEYDLGPPLCDECHNEG